MVYVRIAIGDEIRTNLKSQFYFDVGGQIGLELGTNPGYLVADVIGVLVAPSLFCEEVNRNDIERHPADHKRLLVESFILRVRTACSTKSDQLDEECRRMYYRNSVSGVKR